MGVVIDPLAPPPLETTAFYLRSAQVSQGIAPILQRVLSGKEGDTKQYPVYIEGVPDRIGYLHLTSLNTLIGLLGIDNIYAITPEGRRVEGNMLWSL